MKTNTLEEVAASDRPVLGTQFEVSYGVRTTRLPHAEFQGSTFAAVRNTITKDFGGVPENAPVRCDGREAKMTDTIPTTAQRVEFVAKSAPNG